MFRDGVSEPFFGIFCAFGGGEPLIVGAKPLMLFLRLLDPSAAAPLRSN